LKYQGDSKLTKLAIAFLRMAFLISAKSKIEIFTSNLLVLQAHHVQLSRTIITYSFTVIKWLRDDPKYA